MDEKSVLQLIQCLSKRLCQEFESIESQNKDEKHSEPEEFSTSCRAGNEEMKIVFSQPEIKELDLENYATFWPEKNESVAKQNREDGNVAFQNGNMELAILLYTEALKFSPVHPTLLHGEDMSVSAANRSAALYQLKKYEASVRDVDLALEAGYATEMAYKLYIRKCKCCLELGKISDAQNAFDKAIEAIERSGLKKELRKGIATDLQEAFINLMKEYPTNSVSDTKIDSNWPDWADLPHPHSKYPAAIDSIEVCYDKNKGRHVIAKKDIEVGEVIFRENPLVCYLSPDDTDSLVCLNCFSYIKDYGSIPCPTCSDVVFCSMICRKNALESYHTVECKMKKYLASAKLFRLPLIMLAIRMITQKPCSFFRTNKNDFEVHDITHGVECELYKSDDYKNAFNLVTHRNKREVIDRVTKCIFAGIIVKFLEKVNYLDDPEKLEEDQILIGRLLVHFMQVVQFNTHMIESVYSNRLIASDAETRIWKDAKYFNHGEFVETTRLGGGIFPTIANVNHSCDPNFLLVNVNNKAIAIASRRIRAGEEIHDSYGAVYYHLSKEERINFLKNSHWFECNCIACCKNWPIFSRLPRDYLRLPGSLFKYNRCNRKELQKDVDSVKKKIDSAKVVQNFEHSRQMFHGWMKLLDELIVPPHQDMINVRRGIKNCLWLQSPNIIPVKEDEALLRTKAKFKEKTSLKK
ncbi:unnamed protein product [Lepeophtheirus salmonis]|uniref:Protein-lysine N-methyltransferase SMYD4 n=1 Tax=Lepeophtheirus salmonis TaxID=72036 RepID=A0A0K2TUR6_LEPSM|nr:unnamed protein product [Lepeophtheirus salmonis]CAF2779332.1 unnamed protein product [Lepeophtheirus salmonis]